MKARGAQRRSDKLTVTAAMVKELREKTGLGMMDCKKALVDADGEMEKAIEELRKSSVLKAAKKSGRITANGLLGFRKDEAGSKAVLVEVNIETDFAAKNEKFIAFVAKVADELFDSENSDLALVMDAGLDTERENLVQEIGENITVRRAEVVRAPEGGSVGCYIHSDNLKGSFVVLDSENQDLGRDIAMHVTAINPLVLRAQDVAEETINKEREIYLSQAQESGKPPEIVDKMVDGRIKKFLSEVSLVDQPFVKEPDKKVSELLKASSCEILSFARIEVGEGIESKDEDFAAEVAAQLKDSQ